MSLSTLTGKSLPRELCWRTTMALRVAACARLSKIISYPCSGSFRNRLALLQRLLPCRQIIIQWRLYALVVCMFVTISDRLWWWFTAFSNTALMVYFDDGLLLSQSTFLSHLPGCFKPGVSNIYIYIYKVLHCWQNFNHALLFCFLKKP